MGLLSSIKRIKIIPGSILEELIREGWTHLEDRGKDIEVYERNGQKLLYDNRTDEVLEITGEKIEPPQPY